jgi:hypothetical protein
MKLTRMLFGVLTTTLLIATFLAYGPVHGLFADEHAQSTWHGTWKDTPRSLAETEKLASDIVLAEVSSVEKGPDIVVEAASEPTGLDVIPTQRITLKVEESMKGSASQVVVFHTGDGVQFIPGDPSYAVGERYVLFLTPKDDGNASRDAASTHRVVSPEGRYLVGKDETLTTFSDMAFAKSFNGKALGHMKNSVKAARGEK